MLLFLLVLMFCSMSKAQMTNSLRELVLNEHNKLRMEVAAGKVQDVRGRLQPKASNMKMLEYDRSLENTAQNWANFCTFKHDPNNHKGENLAMHSRANFVDGMIQMWFDEIKAASVNSYSLFSQADFSAGLGHYTQLIWAETGKIGCGYREDCWINGRRMNYLVCRYDPPGNFFGKPIYKPGAPCSGCSSNAQCSKTQWPLCQRGQVARPGTQTEAPPAKTTTTKLLSTGKIGELPPCIDKHRACTSWAAAGYCKNNEWLHINCQKSCDQCGHTRRHAPSCFNHLPCCERWKSRGECSANPLFMEVKCKASCTTCNKDYKFEDCGDYHIHCKFWSKTGHCGTSWMDTNCRKSCDLCEADLSARYSC